MNLNGDHPNKPAGLYCRRSELMRWTGLKEDEIAKLERAKLLITIRFETGGKLGRRYYVVAEVEKKLKEEITKQQRRIEEGKMK